MSLKPTNRFTLEENILDCWNIVDDLKTLYAAPDFVNFLKMNFKMPYLDFLPFINLNLKN